MATKHDAWLGKTRSSEAFIDPWKAGALAAVIGATPPEADAGLPPLWHFLYFLEAAPRDRIAHDGHPVTGDFLPAVENPRRMFAGGRTTHHRPLQLGRLAELTETVENIQEKTGRNGTLYIVTVSYRYRQGGEFCIAEERDFVYLPALELVEPPALPGGTLEPIPDTDWVLDFPTDPVTLFRFSALTFNSHRIHYDLDYARHEEGHPALVVHGPLTAILLAECVRCHARGRVHTFSFRAMNPLFCGQPVRVRAATADNHTIDVIAYTPAGDVAAEASVTIEQLDESI